MNKIIFGSFFLLAMFANLAIGVTQDDDIRHFRSCSQCGMDRKAYGYSRMLVNYGDGSQAGVCSLHCAVTEREAHKGDVTASLLVADRDSRELIRAEKAFWVIGGDKRGVMTKRPKWAFATEAAARRFTTSHGGGLSSWNEAEQAALEDAGLKKQ